MITLADVYKKQSKFLYEYGRHPNVLLLGNVEWGALKSKQRPEIATAITNGSCELSGMKILHLANVESFAEVALMGAASV